MFERRWFPDARGRTLAIAIAALAAASLLTTGAASAGSGGGCIRVDVDQPVRLPDGNVYPAGVLTLCDTAELSPVATLHKTYVNGRPIGILVSRRRANETKGAEPPVVVFQRDRGALDLVGYVLPAPRRSGVTYVLSASVDMPLEGDHLASSSGLSGSLVVLAAGMR
ncbi:MAG: hypothetical protein LAO51_06160 [Acidobacteriia bacterium]|nr:hypothetical protein [Terriglobia bacterium]